jgi:superfamily I DNA/RNA helicase
VLLVPELGKMKVLPNVKPTPEQLKILRHSPRALLIVRGAAGSGKTTTALLRLKVVVDFWQKQFGRDGRHLNVLVLTFNRTLAGYVEALAREQIRSYPHVTTTVSTFDKWARELVGQPDIVDPGELKRKIEALGSGLGLDESFLLDEFHYATGRFLPANLAKYVLASREGRGASPQMPGKLRERLISEVVEPLSVWKATNGQVDFNDIAIALSQKVFKSYDVIVVDETQDFHANRIRAILKQAADPSSITFVLDAAQRIYPHAFKWKEVGIDTAGAVQQLTRNYRNTKQIAAFAKPILEGVDIGDDGTIPDFNAANSIGELPAVLVGRFRAQMSWAVNFIKRQVDLTNESVAFLHAAGGRWFDEIRAQLQASHLSYCELTGSRDYPLGPVNIALSTMHSAKGLEFDHVIILGLNNQVTQHGDEDGDAVLEKLRRLLAMAIGRAKKTLIVGYKPGEESNLISFLEQGTYTRVAV